MPVCESIACWSTLSNTRMSSVCLKSDFSSSLYALTWLSTLVLSVIQCARNDPSWCWWDFMLVKLHSESNGKPLFSKQRGSVNSICCCSFSIFLLQPLVIRQRKDRPASRRTAPYSGTAVCVSLFIIFDWISPPTIAPLDQILRPSYGKKLLLYVKCSWCWLLIWYCCSSHS